MRTPDAARWARLKELFAQIADLPAAERAAALARVAADDPALATDVKALLAEDAAPAHKVDPGGELVRRAVEQAARDAAEHAAALPETIGEYRVLGLLGEGGMGVVYLAEQRSPRRTVALKVMRTAAGRATARRFQREAEVLGRLAHPNIALIHEAGVVEAEGAGGVRGAAPRPFFAMEYVEGLPITRFCQLHELGSRERAAILVKVCDAIQHAHDRGVIHRDLKPANVLVDARGEPKVLDFGIARLQTPEQAATLHTATGEVVGTLPYMSPEQISGNPDAIDQRTDVYALGVLLFELLTGRRPIDLRERSLPEAVRMVSENEPTRLATLDRSLRGDLDTIVAKCLEKAPARRYQTAGALAEDLRRYLDHRPIEARPPSTMYQVAKFARRHRSLVGGVAFAFVTLLLASVVSIILAVQATRARHQAEEQLRIAGIENRRSTVSYQFLERLFTAADPSQSAGKELTVRELLDKARAQTEESKEAPQVLAMLAKMLGTTYFRLGDVKSALSMLEKSLEMQRSPDADAVGRERWLLETLIQLADVRRTAGDFDGARTALDEAVKAFSDMDPATSHYSTDALLASAFNNMSLVEQEQGEFRASEKSCREALALYGSAAAKGRAYPGEVATTTVNLGSALLFQGRLAEAEAAYRSGVAGQTEARGPEAPLTMTAMNNLAVTLKQLGKYEEALTLARRVKEVREKSLPPTHNELAGSISNLANLEFALGRVKEAEVLARDGLARREAALGEHHVDTGRSRTLLAGILAARGQIAEATALTETALRDHLERLKPTHLRVIEDRVILASLRRMAGDPAGGLELAEDAHREAIGTLGDRHFLAWSSADERAACLLALGRAPEAVTELRASLRLRRAVQPESHPELGDARLLLAEAQLAAGEPGLAAEDATAAAGIFAAGVPGAPWKAEYARLVAQAAAASGPEVMRGAAALARTVAADLGDASPWVRRIASLGVPTAAPPTGAADAGAHARTPVAGADAPTVFAGVEDGGPGAQGSRGAAGTPGTTAGGWRAVMAGSQAPPAGWTREKVVDAPDAQVQKFSKGLDACLATVRNVHFAGPAGARLQINVVTACDADAAERAAAAMLRSRGNRVFVLRDGLDVVEFAGKDAVLAEWARYAMGFAPPRVTYDVEFQVAPVVKGDAMSWNRLFNAMLALDAAPAEGPARSAAEAAVAELAGRFQFGTQVWLRTRGLGDAPAEFSASGADGAAGGTGGGGTGGVDVAAGAASAAGAGAAFGPDARGLRVEKMAMKAGVPVISIKGTVGTEMSGITPTNRGADAALLAPTEWWPVDDPRFVTLAQDIVRGAETPRARVEAILRWTRAGSNVKFGGDVKGSRYGAAKVIRQGYGHCWDFSDVFITLCRAAGVPARQVLGWLDESEGHVWAEVLIPGQGWWQVDPTAGAPATPRYVPFFSSEDGSVPFVYVSMPKVKARGGV